LPAASRNIRIDSGVIEGDTVTIFYDPMIAKLIVWGADRPQALQRLRDALMASEIVGPKSNIAFLERLSRHPVVVEGRIDTGCGNVTSNSPDAGDAAPDAAVGPSLERCTASTPGAVPADEDGDGRIDLMNSLPDILASVANYFAKHGWVTGGPVAARAQADGAARSLGDWQAKPQWPLEQLEAWGYAPFQHLNPGEPTSLLTLAGPGGPEQWFTFNNFRVITTYNRSPMYAMAVNQLAQAIMDGVHDADATGSVQ